MRALRDRSLSILTDSPGARTFVFAMRSLGDKLLNDLQCLYSVPDHADPADFIAQKSSATPEVLWVSSTNRLDGFVRQSFRASRP